MAANNDVKKNIEYLFGEEKGSLECRLKTVTVDLDTVGSWSDAEKLLYVQVQSSWAARRLHEGSVSDRDIFRCDGYEQALEALAGGKCAAALEALGRVEAAIAKRMSEVTGPQLYRMEWVRTATGSIRPVLLALIACTAANGVALSELTDRVAAYRSAV